MNLLWLAKRSREKEPPSEMRLCVEKALKDVRAYARSHGGEIQLVDVSGDGIVKVRMTGACRGCPMLDVTLKEGVEQRLKQLAPGVVAVVLAP